MIRRLVSIIIHLMLLGDVFNTHYDASWVDPTDMLRYNPTTKMMHPKIVHEKSNPDDDQVTIDPDLGKCHTNDDDDKQHCNKNAQVVDSPTREILSPRSVGYQSTSSKRQSTVTQNVEALFIVRHVRRLLLMFNISDKSPQERLSLDVLITLSVDDLRVLKLFADSKGSIQDVDRVLGSMMSVVDAPEQPNWIDDVKQALLREEWSEFIRKNVLYVCGGLAFFMLLRWMLWSGNGGLVWKLFFILIFTSVIWEWIFLYQEAKVTKRIQMDKFIDMPIECDPNSMTYFEAFVSYVFSREDRCKEYRTTIMIDAHWSVTPLSAAASALTKTIPIIGKEFGSGLGLFFTSYMNNFGWIEKYFMVVLAVFVLAIFLMYPVSTAIASLSIRRSANETIPQRAMLEDVRDVAERLKRVEAAVVVPPDVAAEPSGSTSAPIIQHHHNNYYFTDKSSAEKLNSCGDISMPEALDNVSIRPELLAICCPRCKSKIGQKRKTVPSIVQDETAELAQVMENSDPEIVDVKSSNENSQLCKPQSPLQVNINQY